MATLTANLPQPSSPMVDPATGIVSQAWWYFFQRLFARTGSGTGGSYGAPAIVDVTASPFQFTAPSNGFVIVAGGGVSQMQFSVDGVTFYAVGAFYGSHPVSAGSLLVVTYVRAPAMTFVPG